MSARNLINRAASLPRQAAAAALILTAAVMFAGCGAEAEQLDTPSDTPSESPSATFFPAKGPPEDGTPAPQPFAPIAVTPAATPEPAPAPAPTASGTLRPGVWVQVVGEGCLNARNRPGLSPAYEGENPDDSIVNCLPEGFIGRLEEFPAEVPHPVDADGHTWWYISAQGWVAQDWIAFHHEGGAFWPPRPDLSGSGLIAYVADRSVLLMNADGSDQRVLAVSAGENTWIENLAWSPTGQQVSYTLHIYSGSDSVVTRIVNLDGTVAAEFPEFANASWSPDGGRLAGTRQGPADPWGGRRSTPVVRDLVSGGETPIGPVSWYDRAPAWSPDGAALSFSCSSSTSTYNNPDGTITTIVNDCGGDGVRIVNADGTNPRVIAPSSQESGPYFAGISWSPEGGTIAINRFTSSGDGCHGITIIDVQSGATLECLPFPDPSLFGCGWGGAERSEWTPDGARIIYHNMLGENGTGIAIVDLATGSETLIPISYVSTIDMALNGQQLVFESAGEVWVANADGTGVAPIAKGSMPAWQPQ